MDVAEEFRDERFDEIRDQIQSTTKPVNSILQGMWLPPRIMELAPPFAE